MKKILFLALALQAAILTGHANSDRESVKDTIIVIRNPEQVIIEKGESHFGVEVQGREADPDFRYSHKMEVSPNSSVITEEKNINWDFKVPFLNKKEKNRPKDEFQVGGIAFGLVNAVNAAQGINVDMGASYELMADRLLNWEYYPWRNGTSFSIGFGFCWRNYRMTGKTSFIKENENLVLGEYPEGADIKFSRIKVFSLTVPLMFNQVIYHRISFSVGPVINFNTHGSLKTRYKLDGKKVKLTDNNIHQNRVTVDFMAQLKFNDIGFYVKYSPSNVLNTEYGPKFSSMSTGITLFY